MSEWLGAGEDEFDWAEDESWPYVMSPESLAYSIAQDEMAEVDASYYYDSDEGLSPRARAALSSMRVAMTPVDVVFIVVGLVAAVLMGLQVRRRWCRITADEDARATVWAERNRYREALEQIAGPPDDPFLGPHGKLAAEALQRKPASPEAIAARAKRDFEHYRDGISGLTPSGKGKRG